MQHYLTVSDVARALGVSKDSVRLYAKTGRLRARRTKSGIRLFALHDVEQFRANRKGTERVQHAQETPTFIEGEE